MAQEPFAPLRKRGLFGQCIRSLLQQVAQLGCVQEFNAGELERPQRLLLPPARREDRSCKESNPNDGERRPCLRALSSGRRA
jgi:hypothetical protein